MASRVTGFEYDIFISYRHNDNKYDGWVTEFVSNLRKELEATVKGKVSIYFDENPQDGLLESHNVDASLSSKIKSLILIPIVSQTYCDLESFAWTYEFKAFNTGIALDGIGPTVKLAGGNVANRVLPVRIHELEPGDLNMLEDELRGKLRAIDFIFNSPGVNRPLKVDDKRDENTNRTRYRDQINKVANAIKDILLAIQRPSSRQTDGQLPGNPSRLKRVMISRKQIAWIAGLLVLFALAYGASQFVGGAKEEVTQIDKSIAVLPFENLSGDPEQEYFSDGMAEEILNGLAQIRDLKVAARTSSFQFKGKQVDLREVGEKLKVSTVLEGSVRKQGDRVKITAQLINVKDGYHLWSQQFERKLDDVFAIQEEIARVIIQKLNVTLHINESIAIGDALPKNKDAYDAILRGRYFWNRRELKESEKYFKQAIALDSTIAAAYSGLALTYVVFPLYDAGPPWESMPKAQQAAEKALRLDSSNSAPYLALAYKSTAYDWNAVKAKKYFIQALEKDPKSAPAHHWYGQYFIFFETDFAKALAEMEQSIELDPLSSVSYSTLGQALLFGRKIPEAIEAFRKGAELNNQNANLLYWLGYCYLLADRIEEANTVIKRSAELSHNRSKALLVYLKVREGNLDKARALFNKLVEASKSTYVQKSTLAMAASYFGEKKLSRQFLRQAMEEHDPYAQVYFSAPGLPGDLFSDQGNVALYKQMHIPK